MECDDKTDLEKEIQALSHEDICEITLSTLRTLLASDKLLGDLPADVTIEEVNSQIAVTQGQSITVQILRNSEGSLNVVVSVLLINCPNMFCTCSSFVTVIDRCEIISCLIFSWQGHFFCYLLFEACIWVKL